MSVVTHREAMQETPQVRRILCLDGGGVLGTFSVAFLAAIEAELGLPIGGYFDLIAGTSTGGILAIALGMGLKASDVLELYQEHGADILGGDDTTITLRGLRRGGGLRWRRRGRKGAEKLRTVLREALGKKRLSEAVTRLLIPAWHPVRQSAYVYRTAHHDRALKDGGTTAVDIALATATAPTHLPAQLSGRGVGLIDGGIWANNPIALAVVEAIGPLGWDPASLRVMSLGCVVEGHGGNMGSRAGDLAQKLKDLFMDGQARGAMGIAELLTGGDINQNVVYRVEHQVPGSNEPVDNAQVLRDVTRMGYAKAGERLPALSYVFFSRPAEPFTAV
jgi:hypothetical protein